MADFAWEQFESGAQFQELVGGILLQEVSKHVRIYGKAGKDFGIDADYRGDYGGIGGSWRFQCKHYASLASLLAELKTVKSKKGEVDTVLGHMSSAPGSKGQRLWEGATHYRLITSVKLSPQDRQEIVDAYAPVVATGIAVDVWGGEWVEATAKKHPLVMQQFFGKDLPMFVPLAEYERQQLLRPFGDLYRDLPYVGRALMAQQFDTFMKSDDVACLFRGGGGVGKTRSLLELARARDDESGLIVRFVQNECTDFSQHVDELPDEARLLLVVDEADRYGFLRALAALARHPRYAGRVKLVLAARGAVSSPVRATLLEEFGARFLEHEIPPVRENLVEIADSLKLEGRERTTLLALADGIPLWLVLGASAIEQGVPIGELTRERVTRAYLDRYFLEIAPEDRPAHQDLLYALSLLEPINIKSETVRSELAKFVDLDVPRMMRVYNDIRSAGFAELFGRFVSISPDLVADYIRLRALFTDIDHLPTDLHQKLLTSPLEGTDLRYLVNNLARAEHLSGRPLLDDLVAEVRAGVATLDNFGRRAILRNLGALAYVRPEAFLDLAEIMLACPQPKSERPITGLEGFTQSADPKEVRDLIAPLLHGPLRWAEHRVRAANLVAALAAEQGYADLAGRGAMRVFAEEAQYEEDGDLGKQHDFLALYQQWFAEGRSTAFPIAYTGLKRILAFEVRYLRSDGWNAIFSRGRVQVSAGLTALRADARTMLRGLLSADALSVRREAAQVLDDAIREASLASGGEEATTAVVLGEDGEPVPVHGRIAGTGDDAYVKAELGRLFDLVENAVEQEDDGDVLETLHRSINWHAQFAAETDLGKRALRVRAAVAARPGYRFFAVVRGLNHDLEAAAAEESAILDEILRETSPTQFLESFTNAAAGTRLFGGAAGLLQSLALRDPAFARSVLDLAVAKPTTLSAFYAARLLVGIHIGGADRTLLRQFAELRGWARAAAVEACCRLRPAWHPGFLLGEEEFALLADFARSDDPTDWRPIAEFLWLIAESDPVRVLGLAVLLVEHEDHGWTAGVAQVCVEVLKHRPDLREPIVALMEVYATVSDLADHHVEDAISRLGAADLDWLVGFFEARVAHGEEAGLSAYRFPAVPAGFERLLPQRAQSNPGYQAALERVLSWTSRSTRWMPEAEHLLKGLVGERVNPGFLEATRTYVTRDVTSEKLRGLGSVLHAFKDDCLKFVILGECVSKVTLLPPVERADVVKSFARSVPSGCISGAMGKVPPALALALRLVADTRRYFQGDLNVAQMADLIEKAVRQEIVEGLESDAEALKISHS